MSQPLKNAAPKRAIIAAASSGDNTILAAVAGKRFRVTSYVLVAAGAVSAKWRSATNDMSGAMALAANGGVSADDAAAGVLETNPGEALVINLSGAVATAGHLTYVELS
jgi:hypothetical protein